MCCGLLIQVWKGEAFKLWTTSWAALYEAGSLSAKTLTEVKNTYFLVSLLDNNYIDGNMFKFLGGVKGGPCMFM